MYLEAKEKSNFGVMIYDFLALYTILFIYNQNQTNRPTKQAIGQHCCNRCTANLHCTCSFISTKLNLCH